MPPRTMPAKRCAVAERVQPLVVDACVHQRFVSPNCAKVKVPAALSALSNSPRSPRGDVRDHREHHGRRNAPAARPRRPARRSRARCTAGPARSPGSVGQRRAAGTARPTHRKKDDDATSRANSSFVRLPPSIQAGRCRRPAGDGLPKGRADHGAGGIGEQDVVARVLQVAPPRPRSRRSSSLR